MDRGRSQSYRTEQAKPSPFQTLEVLFADTCPEDLQCQICMSVARDPVVTEDCGHLYCRSCIMLALERKHECPFDRQPLVAEQLRRDVRSHRRIQSLSCFCFYHHQGCIWRGEYSDLEVHADKCDFAPVECPFAPHGCTETLTRSTMLEHINMKVAHHLALVSQALVTMSDENMVLQQELELSRREDRFVWVIPRFESKQGPLYSRKFFAKGLMWYIGVDFESPDEHAGVYLFADGHSKRVDFKLILYHVDPTKDKVHEVNDWSLDYKGKGWGPLKFIDRSRSAQAGFLVNGCMRIGAEIDGTPFD